MAEELYIPKLGQTVEEVTIIRWLLEDGSEVKQGQEIVEVQTDKAVFPVEANADGFLHIGPYEMGDVVPVLTVVAIIGRQDDKFEIEVGHSTEEPEAPQTLALGAGPATGARAPLQEVVPATSPKDSRIFASPRARQLLSEKGVNLSLITPTGGGGMRVVEQDVVDYLARIPRVSPVAQRMAEEADLDLLGVVGTGPGGRITKADVEHPRRGEPVPEADVLKRVPLTGVRGVIAQRMEASARSTAAVTLMMEVDVDQLVELRNRLREKTSGEGDFVPSYNDLFVKIVASALRQFPFMNARLAGDAIELLDSVNVGLAVDTRAGLLVVVVRDADQKGLRQVGTELRESVERARNGRALPDDLSGGTFTVSNLGMYDVDAFTPVINLPEAAILGFGRIAPKPTVHDGAVVVRHMCTFSLTFDHRLVDGAPAARFLQYIKNLIEEPYRWLML